MFSAVITGDIVASTSLNDSGRQFIEAEFKRLFDNLRVKFNMFGRNIQGDYIECVVPDPVNSLRIALLIKTFVKTIPLKESTHFISCNKTRKFHSHGIRLAIGLGNLSRFDREKGIIDGEAVYLAGRKINKYSTYNKERIVIKETLFLVANDMSKYEQFVPMLALIDFIINKATSKQCQVLFLKLQGLNEEDISGKMKISQPTVNRHSGNIGWNAFEKTIDYFEKSLKV